MGIAYSIGGKFYDYLDERFEKQRYYAIRQKMLQKLEGKVLDAGCGTGRNFIHYSPKANVIGIDKSEGMLEVAQRRAQQGKANIQVRKMDVTNLDFPDNSFDNVVGTFLLCVLPEEIERKALDEMVRVAKPGAHFYFLEYVYSQNPRRRMAMKLTSFIPKLLFDMRYNTTLPLVRQNKSLKVEHTEFVYQDVVRMIVARKEKYKKTII